MEKLSKLLNEYLESKKKDIQQFMNIAALMTQSDSKLYQTYIISKDFEFIKWLVENDKIDFNKDAFISLSSELGCTAYDEKIVLMVLSISNSPIEDLLLYLK